MISKGDHRGRFLWEPDFSFTDVICVPCSPHTLTKKKARKSNKTFNQLHK